MMRCPVLRALGKNLAVIDTGASPVGASVPGATAAEQRVSLPCRQRPMTMASCGGKVCLRRLRLQMRPASRLCRCDLEGLVDLQGEP